MHPHDSHVCCRRASLALADAPRSRRGPAATPPCRVGTVNDARPEPGAELNPGAETVPRPAATVILLRGGHQTLEVLLAQRNPQARFMGGAWVFPGGAV